MAGGRPTDYRPEYAEQAAKLCSLGATDIEIADFFGVSESTVNRWKITHPEFCVSIKAAKEAANDRVERSLYSKATGYEFQSEKIFCDPKTGDVTRVPIREIVPPSDTAIIFWLKNRKRDEWRDKVETEHSGNLGLTMVTAVPRPER